MNSPQSSSSSSPSSFQRCQECEKDSLWDDDYSIVPLHYRYISRISVKMDTIKEEEITHQDQEYKRIAIQSDFSKKSLDF